MRGVIIDNRPADQVLIKHDKEDTLHYVDPPYLLNTRNSNSKCYRFEMSNEEHEHLCCLLRSLSGYVILSGYDNELYNDMLIGWIKKEKECYADGASPRKEVLWINRQEKGKQISMFN